MVLFIYCFVWNESSLKCSYVLVFFLYVKPLISLCLTLSVFFVVFLFFLSSLWSSVHICAYTSIIHGPRDIPQTETAKDSFWAPFPYKHNCGRCLGYLLSSVEPFSNVTEGRHNVPLFSPGTLGQSEDPVALLVWLRADYQKWTFETCQQFQRRTQWHFNLKNYKHQHSSHWPCHLPRNAQWDGCEGVIDKDGSVQGPNQARAWQLRLFWTLSKAHTPQTHWGTDHRAPEPHEHAAHPFRSDSF